MVGSYTELFEKALYHIRLIRSPLAEKQELKDMNWNQGRKQNFMNFAGDEFCEYKNIVEKVSFMTHALIYNIIQYLIKKHEVDLEYVKIEQQIACGTPIIFTLRDKKKNELIFFKEMENSPFYKFGEGEEIESLLKEKGVRGCNYVYLMYDEANVQVIRSKVNDDLKDRDTNIHALKWFFETYFENESWSEFETRLKEYFEKVDDIIGRFPVKTLTANSVVNFRKITENTLEYFPYEELLKIKQKKKGKEYFIKETELEKIYRQFKNDGYFQVMVGKSDFAESLLTAEWLYDSMQKVKAIDLTVIGMGYFKAVEQLMYELTSCFQKESKHVKSQCFVNEDSTLGAMAMFYVENKEHIFNNQLQFNTRKYVIENLFNYARLRNGYFHKHNIKKMEVIDNIKKETYYTIFLLLGTFAFYEINNNIFKPKHNRTTDFYKLCEYINYHRDGFFVIKMDAEEEVRVKALPDSKAKTVDEQYVQYTGIYFQTLEGNRIIEKALPTEIWTAVVDEEMRIKKKVLVFKEGKFVGPEITREEGFTY